MSEEFQVPVLSDDPTPDERAEYVIMRLEQFIREGRTFAEGMSFKVWQAMAKVEIAIAIAEAELGQQQEEAVTKRLLFTFAGALVTVGFWGTAVSIHKVGYLVGGIICGLAGLVLLGIAGEWRFRKWNKSRKADKRRKSLARVENINRRIKRLENELEKEEKKLKEKIKKIAGAAG
ncbi:MAG: hypothetical protein H8E39_02270 [Alphaproteobacteria bacterium]|nr:hypothetical protein [Alphaproteobacteria bacterium]